MRKCCIEEINEIAQLRNHTNDSIIQYYGITGVVSELSDLV